MPILRQCTINYTDEFFGSIIFHLGVNVHSSFAVLMPCKILNRLRVYSGIKQICDISVTELVRGHFKVHCINNIRIVLLVRSQSRLFRVLDPLTIYHLMSRVAKCIDNGPMEGFWGILKRERYYGRRFTSREELVSTIENYITYYNNRRVQRNLGVLTPMEKHYSYLLAA